MAARLLDACSPARATSAHDARAFMAPEHAGDKAAAALPLELKAPRPGSNYADQY